jgi:hypothetical protein
MTWYINRGEDMQRDQRVVFPFYRSLPSDFKPSILIFKDELIECAHDQAPLYPKAGVTMHTCTLNSGLTGVNQSLFKNRIGITETPYVDVYYNLVVTMQSAMMKVSLEVDGEEMGSVQAKYD